MQARFHVAASAIVSTAAYALTGSAATAAASFFAGIFIDADHVLDYVALHRPPYSLRGLFDLYYEHRLTRVFLVCHSWELLLLITLAAMALQWEPILTGLAIGMTHHLLLDQYFNNAHPLGYFLTYRVYAGLAFSRCFRRPEAPDHQDT